MRAQERAGERPLEGSRILFQNFVIVLVAFFDKLLYAAAPAGTRCSPQYLVVPGADSPI